MRGKGTTAHGTIALLDEASAGSIHCRAAILAANQKRNGGEDRRPTIPGNRSGKANLATVRPIPRARDFPGYRTIWTPKIHPFAANDRRFHPATSSLRGSHFARNVSGQPKIG